MVNVTLRPLNPRERETEYQLYRRLGGPQGRSGRLRKISPIPGFDPSTIQPVASRCTYWAIAAHYLTICTNYRCQTSNLTPHPYESFKSGFVEHHVAVAGGRSIPAGRLLAHGMSRPALPQFCAFSFSPSPENNARALSMTVTVWVCDAMESGRIQTKFQREFLSPSSGQKTQVPPIRW